MKVLMPSKHKVLLTLIHCVHLFINSCKSLTSPIHFYQVKSHQKCAKINLEKKQRIVIIGAGPTGLGVAYRLYELGVLRSRTQVAILEQTDEPGGLASSYRDKYGFLWDNGGHVIFSHYPYYDRVLDKAVSEWTYHSRAAYAYMMGSSGRRRFIPYPVQNNIHLFEEGLKRHPKYKKASTFVEWFVNNFEVLLFMRKDKY